MAAAAALAELNQALVWIGFGDQRNRDTICEEAGFLSFEDSRFNRKGHSGHV